jgi:hypothetical protein
MLTPLEIIILVVILLWLAGIIVPVAAVGNGGPGRGEVLATPDADHGRGRMSDTSDEAYLQCVLGALKAARAAANQNGHKRGSGGVGTLKCPVCNGVLHYSVAGSNGHLWGSCETEGCVRWAQ